MIDTPANSTGPADRFVALVEGALDRLGKSIAWLLLLMVVLQSLIVLLRYGLEFGSIALQESVSYLHASCFMLGAAYTLKVDEHVRVDIFYRNFSERQRAWVNLVGTLLLLLPLTLFITWLSIDYVAQAWRIKESSADSGGLPLVYLLKTLIPLFALTLLCQGLAELVKNTLRIRRTFDSSNPPAAPNPSSHSAS